MALFFAACSSSNQRMIDKLNDISYDFHYKNLDSTYYYAMLADSLSGGYDEGKAAALNNLAFYHIARMDYNIAYDLLRQVAETTDNQVELLVADIQLMRLCQRESRNKDFYVYREKAQRRLRRVDEEPERLSDRQKLRMIYARSEFHIVEATYFYYVNSIDSFRKSLYAINPEEIQQDTAQYLGYLYNMGAGGVFPGHACVKEFGYLLRCYTLAADKYPYWKANSLQAMSEHLWNDDDMRDLSWVYHFEFNTHHSYPDAEQESCFIPLFGIEMPDSLKSIDLAQRSLSHFTEYGDVYQIAGANRTLAQCYFNMGDYESSLYCLNRALAENKAIEQAPDLVASIREELSLTYSALNDKQQSDYNRNIYLDIQEQTRQDRFLEARAAQLDKSSKILNGMIAAVVAMILAIIILLIILTHKRANAKRVHPLAELLEPLKKWKEINKAHVTDLLAQEEELQEKYKMGVLLKEKQLTRNVEQRAKIQLVNSITPFIDRMMHEIDVLSTKKETPERSAERYQYLMELTGKINEYNDVLTRWIEMRQGDLQLKIESFPLQPLFDIVAKGKMAYDMRGIKLQVKPTSAIVKADKALTLFMVNTIADNARKFTVAGGNVTIEAQEVPDSVEIIVTDTGEGMSEDKLAHLFDRTYTGGHGFGLLNCKGIIEKYKKVSSIFHVCDIWAVSQMGKGSRISFRLPKGIMRVVLLLCGFTAFTSVSLQAQGASRLEIARELADSAYNSNIAGRFERALHFADSATLYIEAHATSYVQKNGLTKHAWDKSRSDGWNWFQKGVDLPYDVLLTLYNEKAIAALALHKWEVYQTNNKAYTELFRAYSADVSLPTYVTTLQQSEANKIIAVALLVLLLLSIFPVYYFLYYRHVLYRRFAVEKINDINETLLSAASDKEKLARIETIWRQHKNMGNTSREFSDIVAEIEEALRQSIAADKDKAANLEIATDELRRVNYESERLHVSNSVLDNCLSTLKHETMYYPARIQQLIVDHPEDVMALRELVDYYHSLYVMLSRQAAQQVEGNLRYDDTLVEYLFDTLRKIAGDIRVNVKADEKQDSYIIYNVYMPKVTYTEEQRLGLFTPLTVDLRYLICKQIVREIGEATNLRRCGILALPATIGTEIKILLPKLKQTVI